MKDGPSQKSTGRQSAPPLYFDLLADFFNGIGPFPPNRMSAIPAAIGSKADVLPTAVNRRS
jgi:hypothetical protein